MNGAERLPACSSGLKQELYAMPASLPTRYVIRFTALLQALRDGPLPRPELLKQLGSAYPATASARVMLDRDMKLLAELGIVITISRTRPPIYTLHGGTPLFSADDLRALALIRESFGENHPQRAAIHSLLGKLTAGLSEQELAEFARSQPGRAPLQPAIDYTPCAPIIARLEQARSQREIIRFAYTNSQGQRKVHEVEPYEIEYYERHFYLVAYHFETRQVLDYRVDRISDIRVLRTLPPHLSRTHTRTTIHFRYRLAASLAQGEISQRFDNQRVVERLPNGDAIIEAEGRSDFFVKQTLLRYRGNAELLHPAWLREQMAEEVRRMMKMYADVDDGMTG